MDIKNLIRRLQDIDKIKIILFDEKGLQEFEKLPKPIAKQNKENSNLTQAQLSEAIDKSFHLKSIRRIINENTKNISDFNQTKERPKKENNFINNNLSNYIIKIFFM